MSEYRIFCCQKPEAFRGRVAENQSEINIKHENTYFERKLS
jgi:hypothetical protein